MLGGTLLLWCWSLCACAWVPDTGPVPQLQKSDGLAAAQSLSAAPRDWPEAEWWHAFGDAQLNALIAEGLEHSPDLMQAAARLQQAEAQAQLTQANAGPNASANAQGGLLKQSYNNGIPAQFVPKGYRDTGRIAFDLGYDLDFWGRNRAAIAAATSEAEAAHAEHAQAQLTLSTAIAEAYGDLARLQVAQKIAAQLRDLRGQIASLAAQRTASGLENRGNQRAQEAELSGAEVEVNQADEQLELARHRLAALLGAGPDRGLDVLVAAPQAPHEFGLPEYLQADLLGRRPDLAAARARAQAAAKRIDMAEAAFYPDVNLSAFIGLQSLGLNNLTRSGSDIGQAALALSLPIFDGGALRASYRRAGAEYAAAVASYNQTLVHALQEVADAATSRHALDGQLRDARAAEAAAIEAESITRRRYESGIVSLLPVLDAQDRLALRRRITLDLQVHAFTLEVALIKALGGGYGHAPMVSANLSTPEHTRRN